MNVSPGIIFTVITQQELRLLIDVVCWCNGRWSLRCFSMAQMCFSMAEMWCLYEALFQYSLVKIEEVCLVPSVHGRLFCCWCYPTAMCCWLDLLIINIRLEYQSLVVCSGPCRALCPLAFLLLICLLAQLHLDITYTHVGEGWRSGSSAGGGETNVSSTSEDSLLQTF